MTAQPVRLLVVSAVRDEALHAERLARCVMAQTRAPDLWLAPDRTLTEAEAAAARDAAVTAASEDFGAIQRTE